jgi:hypothetical protein
MEIVLKSEDNPFEINIDHIGDLLSPENCFFDIPKEDFNIDQFLNLSYFTACEKSVESKAVQESKSEKNKVIKWTKRKLSNLRTKDCIYCRDRFKTIRLNKPCIRCINNYTEHKFSQYFYKTLEETSIELRLSTRSIRELWKEVVIENSHLFPKESIAWNSMGDWPRRRLIYLTRRKAQIEYNLNRYVLEDNDFYSVENLKEAASEIREFGFYNQIGETVFFVLK